MKPKDKLKIWGCQAYCPDIYNSCRLHNDECSVKNTTVEYTLTSSLAKPSREELVDKINRLIEYAEGAANICDGIGHRTVAECVRREIATVKRILDLCCGEEG